MFLLIPATILAAVLFIAGAILTVIGVRGRQTDIRHYCRRCGYEESFTSDRCPECGRRLLLSSDRIAFDMNHPLLARLFAVTRRGRRKLLLRTFAAGLFMTLIGGGMLGGVVWSEAADFDWNRVKPTSMLLSQADRYGGQPMIAQAAWNELARRARAGRLNADAWEQFNDILDRWAPESPRIIVRAPIAADIPEQPRRMREPTRIARVAASSLPRPTIPAAAPTFVVVDGFDASLGAMRSESTGYADEIRAAIPAERVRLTRQNRIQPIRTPDEPRPLRPVGFDSLLSPGDSFGRSSSWNGAVLEGRGLSRSSLAFGPPSAAFAPASSNAWGRSGFMGSSSPSGDTRIANRLAPVRDGSRLDNRVSAPRP